MSDVYQYWRASMAGKSTADELGALMLPTISAPIPGENPQPGLYKVRLAKGAPHVLMQVWLVDEAEKPASQWRAGLDLRGIVDGSYASPQALAERWLFALPVSKDDATYWRQHGRWPGDAPPLSHNAPADPFEALMVEVEERASQAKELLAKPIADQLGCDKARNLQAELLALAKRADGMHEVEKRPHLEAGRKVDERFRFRDALKALSDDLRNAFGAWMAAEERRLQEAAAAKHREEFARVEAERKRIEDERAAKLRDDPTAALTDPEPELPVPPPAPEPVKVQAGGGRGRKAGLQTNWEFTFTEYKLAALHVCEDPAVAVEVGKAIKRRIKAAKGKIDIPGVKITEVRRAA